MAKGEGQLAVLSLRRILGRLRDRWNADVSARQQMTLERIDHLKILCARVLLDRQRDLATPHSLSEIEFKVFSQFGDDGIIQFLIRHVEPFPPPVFVEFGVEDYQESNTRFLLLNNNWRGLVMDADRDNIRAIRNESLYWRHELTAVPAFVERDNINQLIAGAGFDGGIGLLSIDIDGNDYWVWEALTAVDPSIVVIEYNSVFGSRLAVTIPYEGRFERRKAHYSNLYWGASLKALWLLGRQKGYAFVGCNSNGNNAYFVKEGRLGGIPSLSVEEGYVTSRFRESRDPDGRLTFATGFDRLGVIRHLTLYNLESGKMMSVADLDG